MQFTLWVGMLAVQQNAHSLGRPRSVWRHMLVLIDTTGARFELALDLLEGGAAFEFEGVSFRLSDQGYLEVAVPSSWMLENVTADRAQDDFARAAAVLGRLSENERFREIVGSRFVRFVLLSGPPEGRVAICQFDGTKLEWN